MTPEEKPSSAEMAAEAIGIECHIHPVNQISGPQPTQRFADFLAGAQWQAAQVAEAVGKLEEAQRPILEDLKKNDSCTCGADDWPNGSVERCYLHDALTRIDAAIATLKGAK